MAIQFVGSAGGGRSGATSGTDVMSLTALTGGIDTTAREGDIVIVAIATGSVADRTLTINTAGYTYLSDQYANDTVDVNMRVGWKRMGSTPDTQVLVNSSLNNADAQNFVTRVYRGVDATTPFDVASVLASGTNSFLVNPGAITPVTQGAWVLAIGAGGHTAGATQAYAASDLSNVDTRSRDDTYDVSLCSGDKVLGDWTSGAVDPAAFTHGSADSTNYSWVAITIALRPAIDALTAVDDAALSEVTKPAIAQKHALTSVDTAAASEVTKPTLTQVISEVDLTAVDAAAPTEVTKPVVRQKQNLTAVDPASLSEVTKPTVRQKHNVTAVDPAALSEVTKPTIHQKHALTATDAASASEVTKPEVNQKHALTAQDVAAASEVTKPVLARIPNLAAQDVSASSEVTKPTLKQKHALTAENVESASEVTPPDLVNVPAGATPLSAEDTQAATEVTKPAIKQVHALTAQDVEAGSEVTKPTAASDGAATVRRRPGAGRKPLDIGRERRYEERGILKAIKDILGAKKKKRTPEQFAAAAQAVLDYPALEEIDFSELSRSLAKMVDGVDEALSRTDLAHQFMEMAEEAYEDDDEEVIQLLIDKHIDELFGIEGI